METKTTTDYTANINQTTTGTSTSTTTPINSTSTTTTINYGWICPICGRGISPNQSVCPCRGDYKYIPVPIYPSYPIYPYYWWEKVTCSTKD